MFLESRFTNASRHARGVVAARPHADIRAGGGVSGQNIRMGKSSPGVLPPKPSLPVVQRPIKGRRLQHQQLNVAGKKNWVQLVFTLRSEKATQKAKFDLWNNIYWIDSNTTAVELA